MTDAEKAVRDAENHMNSKVQENMRDPLDSFFCSQYCAARERYHTASKWLALEKATHHYVNRTVIHANKSPGMILDDLVGAARREYEEASK